jgi:STE24 endopeptidase
VIKTNGAFLATLLLLLFLGGALRLGASQSSSPPSPADQQQARQISTERPEAASRETIAYTLPPDLYKKSQELERLRLSLFVISPIYGLVVLLLVLRWKLATKYRIWAETFSSRLLPQCAVFAPLLLLTIDVLSLPVDIFEHWEVRKYNLSVQGWVSWAWDWTKSELLYLFLAIFIIAILYAVIRKSPGRWWLYFWMVLIPIGILLTFLQPVVVDPLFHKFEPLSAKDPSLVAALEMMVQRAGENIPPQRMFWMNASEKVNELNAYVTGIGASKRIVVWDTTIARMTTPEIVAVVGHEMGHYVLHHIPKGMLFYAALAFVLFYVGYRIVQWAVNRWGSILGIQGVGDLASLPILVIVLGVLIFVVTPVGNAFSRHLEHQADQYALEVTHGLTPNSAQIAAQTFQILGEVDLEYPNPGPFDVIMTYDHPPIRDRVLFSLTYNPWAQGGTGTFVH